VMTDEEIAELMGEPLDGDEDGDEDGAASEQASAADPAHEPAVAVPDALAETDETGFLADLDELFFYIGTVIAARDGIKGHHPQLDHIYLAGRNKIAFVYDAGSAVITVPDELPPELVRIGDTVAAYLEGKSS